MDFFSDYSFYTLFFLLSCICLYCGVFRCNSWRWWFDTIAHLLIQFPQLALPTLLEPIKSQRFLEPTFAAVQYAKGIPSIGRFAFQSRFSFIFSFLGQEQLRLLQNIKTFILIILITIAIYTFIKRFRNVATKNLSTAKK